MTQKRREFLTNMAIAAAVPALSKSLAFAEQNDFMPLNEFERARRAILNYDPLLADDLVTDLFDDNEMHVLGEPTPTKIRMSPNFDADRKTNITHIVLHNTEASYYSTIQTFLTPNSKASAHILVARDGTVVRLVADNHVAWHARTTNPYSLGIEIVAHDEAPGITAAQETAVVRWVRYWKAKYGIQKKNITMHRLAQPGSTDCPNRIWHLGSDDLFYTWRNGYFSQS